MAALSGNTFVSQEANARNWANSSSPCAEEAAFLLLSLTLSQKHFGISGPIHSASSWPLPGCFHVLVPGNTGSPAPGLPERRLSDDNTNTTSRLQRNVLEAGFSCWNRDLFSSDVKVSFRGRGQCSSCRSREQSVHLFEPVSGAGEWMVNC